LKSCRKNRRIILILLYINMKAHDRFIIHSLDHLCFMLSSKLWKLFCNLFSCNMMLVWVALSSLLNLFFLLLWIPYGEVKEVTSKFFFHFLKVLPHTSSYFYRGEGVYYFELEFIGFFFVNLGKCSWTAILRYICLLNHFLKVFSFFFPFTYLIICERSGVLFCFVLFCFFFSLTNF
jgi:hypothetical protein